MIMFYIYVVQTVSVPKVIKYLFPREHCWATVHVYYMLVYGDVQCLKPKTIGDYFVALDSSLNLKHTTTLFALSDHYILIYKLGMESYCWSSADQLSW